MILAGLVVLLLTPFLSVQDVNAEIRYGIRSRNQVKQYNKGMRGKRFDRNVRSTGKRRNLVSLLSN
jgi:hypothetical protein